MSIAGTIGGASLIGLIGGALTAIAGETKDAWNTIGNAIEKGWNWIAKDAPFTKTGTITIGNQETTTEKKDQLTSQSYPGIPAPKPNAQDNVKPPREEIIPWTWTGTGTETIPIPGTETGTETGTEDIPIPDTNVAEKEETIPPTNNEIKDMYPGGQMDIQDKTNENQEFNLDGIFEDYFDRIREEQQIAWDREDAIRKETQEREDTAYQRAVKDMQKAGINPNLMNVQPASAGGGITQVNSQTAQGIREAMTNTAGIIQHMIDNNFKGDENEKDRFMQSITSLVALAAMFFR